MSQKHTGRDLVYKRVSRDSQSIERQTHALNGAGLTGALTFEDPATSSRVPALDRPGFKALALVAHPGDRLTVSELYRLCRDVSDIVNVREWCRARGVELRVLTGALSNFTDLAASDPTTDLIVNVLVAVGQFQRDNQRELTVEGLAAATAAGRKGGRRPAADVDAVRADWADGMRSIKALSVKHCVSRGAIRTALGELLAPAPVAAPVERTALYAVAIPGIVADELTIRATMFEDHEWVAERAALASAVRRNHGKGYTLVVTASEAVHREFIADSWKLAESAGTDATPATRKGMRDYGQRLADAVKGEPSGWQDETVTSTIDDTTPAAPVKVEHQDVNEHQGDGVVTDAPDEMPGQLMFAPVVVEHQDDDQAAPVEVEPTPAEDDTITVKLTRTQVDHWLAACDHLPEGDDAELSDLWHVVNGGKGKQSVKLTLTRAQACDLVTYAETAAGDRDMTDPAERGLSVALSAMVERLYTAGAEGIEAFNARTAAL